MLHTKRRGLSVGNLAVHLVFLCWCAVVLVPLALILSVSLSDENLIFTNGFSLLPQGFTLSAYQYIFSGSSPLLSAYGVTVFVTVMTTFLHLLVTSMLAYPLSRPELKYRRALSFYVTFPLLFGGGLVPWYLVLTQLLHLKNSVWALVVPYVVSSTYTLLMRNFFSTVPRSLIEAARIDGARELRILFTIVMPLAKPILATIGLFVAVFIWNDWYTCSLLIDDIHKFNLSFLLQTIMNNLQYIAGNPMMQGAVKYVPGEGARMAMCVLAIGPIILCYPFLQKYFQKGLTFGAVKE